MNPIASPANAYSCALMLKRIRRYMPHHPLFDVYAELLFELVCKGEDYRNAPEWLGLQQQLQRVESSMHGIPSYKQG